MADIGVKIEASGFEEIEKEGLFRTLEQGKFAGIKRPIDGGKGLDGVTLKEEVYFITTQELEDLYHDVNIELKQISNELDVLNKKKEKIIKIFSFLNSGNFLKKSKNYFTIYILIFLL